MQAQTFAQISRTHTDRIQALQQAQGHREVVHQVVDLVFLVTRQPTRQCLQRILQVAIFIERFNQKPQGGLIGGAKAQAQGLPVQVVLQRLLGARQLGGVELVAAFQVIAVCPGLAAPLAVVWGNRGAAIALPALAVVLCLGGAGCIVVVA